MSSLCLPDALLTDIYKHAEQEYPRECCGVILSTVSSPGELKEVRRCQNAQDRYHRQDPASFPRGAETAYFIDPGDLLKIQKECRGEGKVLRVIYHSHVNAEAYFSDEDKRMAVSDGELAYPQAVYMVVSVIKGRVRDHRFYCWDPSRQNFTAIHPK